MKPTTIQKNYFRNWFGCYRYTYNFCVNLFNKGTVKTKLRKTLTELFKLEIQKFKWLTIVPYEITDSAILDFIKAVKSNFVKKKKFKMQFKSKKATSSSLPIRVRDIIGTKKNRDFILFPKKCNSFKKIITCEPIIFKDSMTRLIFKRNTRSYYFTVTENKIVPKRELKTIVALDPGIRIFQTIYSLDGTVHFCGVEFRKKINKIYSRIDSIKSDYTVYKKRSLHRKKLKLYEKIKNLISDLHYRTIKTLEEFDVILLPEFGTQKMLQSLPSKRNKELSSLSHYLFKQRLSSSVLKKNQKLFIVSEAYSTVSCSNCDSKGICRDNLFICKKCDFKDHRDINPCKNILKWYLPKLHTLKPVTNSSNLKDTLNLKD